MMKHQMFRLIVVIKGTLINVCIFSLLSISYTDFFFRKVNCDQEPLQSTKKQRFQFSNFGVIRRHDFACQEAWERFIKFMALTKSTIQSLVKKNNRMRNKVDSLQDMIGTLKKQNLITDSAAKTLEVSIKNLLMYMSVVNQSKNNFNIFQVGTL